MAKATATLTCKFCGKEFEKTAIKYNRREADDWIKWAEANFDTCPSCYHKKCVEEEKAAGLIAKVRFGSPYEDSEWAWFILHGDTFPIKEDLKKLGAWWTDEYPDQDNSTGATLLYGLSMQRPLKRWAIRCPLNETKVAEIQSKLEAIGFCCVLPSAETIQLWHSVRAESQRMKNEKAHKEAAEKSEKERAIASALAELGPKPEYPDEIKALWPDGATWNGKIYGRSKHYSVYFNGQKIDLTDEQADIMEKAYAARLDWAAKRKEIMGE